jgi:N-acetylneuraminic acid mutarotase
MRASRSSRFGLALFVVLALSGTAQARNEPPSFELADRIACQDAIERVYARHRSGGRDPAAASAVPPAVVRRKAEDGVLKSVALEHLFGVTLTGEQLQAEVERMAAHSQAPDVLRELLDALDGDPTKAAQCLARPLLADRLIRSYYAHDDRVHGDLKARAQRELAGAGSSSLPRDGSGVYSELEWRRGPSRAPGVVGLEPKDFDARVREVRSAFGGATGALEIARVSALREDDDAFRASSVLAVDDERLRLATVEWRKRSFDSWWSETRRRLPLRTLPTPFAFRKPAPPGTRCRDDGWKPTLGLLDPRYWHTAVWTGSEMIVFGGMSSVGTVYGDGSRYDPATDTWSLVSPMGAPGRRQSHVAVWTGSEMVVWGGRGDPSGGRYDPVTDTWRPMSTANAPAPRWNASVVWTGTQMIVWGGDNGFVLNSGGRYDPASDAWTPLPNAPLAPRAYHAAAWTGSQMVVWGGYNGYIGQMYGDGARYDLATNSWLPVSGANAPNARFYHTAVWTGSEVVVWGGLNYPVYDLSGGRYNPVTDTWTPTSLAGAPSLRWFHAAVWTGTEMIVEGGTPGVVSGGRYRPATDTWTATSSTNSAHNGQGITAVWTGTEMILWGGLDDDFFFHNDGGRYDPAGNVWRPTGTMNVPAARGLHAAAWTGIEMIVWGGFSWGGQSRPGGVYDPATDSWRTVTTEGAPYGRENVTAVWTGNEVIFWGGEPDGNPFEPGTGGRYDPRADSWSLTSTVNAATNRYGHSAVWTGSEMIVFGGVGTDTVAKRYRPATDTWTDATTVGAPGARDHHAAVWTGTRMIVWGGFINDGITPTGGRYDPATDTWAPTDVSGSPPTRMWPIGEWTGTEMIVWGGYDWLFIGDLGDGARYNPVTDTWVPTSLSGAPSPRVAQGVWTGRELVLWGGVDDSSGGRYDPTTDLWRATTLVGAPEVRWGGRWSTVWTGYQMIVWGGEGPTQQGSLYCASGRLNIAPGATGDAYGGVASHTLVVGNTNGVLANDTDANGDALIAVLAAGPLHGVLQLNANGSFLYTPAPGFTGRDGFGYRAFDGLATSNLAQVQIVVQ